MDQPLTIGMLLEIVITGIGIVAGICVAFLGLIIAMGPGFTPAPGDQERRRARLGCGLVIVGCAILVVAFRSAFH